MSKNLNLEAEFDAVMKWVSQRARDAQMAAARGDMKMSSAIYQEIKRRLEDMAREMTKDKDVKEGRSLIIALKLQASYWGLKAKMSREAVIPHRGVRESQMETLNAFPMRTVTTVPFHQARSLQKYEASSSPSAFYYPYAQLVRSFRLESSKEGETGYSVGEFMPALKEMTWTNREPQSLYQEESLRPEGNTIVSGMRLGHNVMEGDKFIPLISKSLGEDSFQQGLAFGVYSAEKGGLYYG